VAAQWGRNWHAHVTWCKATRTPPALIFKSSLSAAEVPGCYLCATTCIVTPNSTDVPFTVWSFLCRLVASAPLPSIDGAAGCPVMSTDHPSMQQAFHVLKDHAEAVECLQAQLKRCGWGGPFIHSVTDGFVECQCTWCGRMQLAAGAAFLAHAALAGQSTGMLTSVWRCGNSESSGCTLQGCPRRGHHAGA
jgi:hypothetical protein